MGREKPFQAPAVIDHVAPLQAAVIGIDHEAQEAEPLCDRPGVRRRVDGEPETRHSPDDGLAPLPQGFLVSGEHETVVHVPHVAPAPQFALDEVVEGVQVAVGPELAGEDWARSRARWVPLPTRLA